MSATTLLLLQLIVVLVAARACGWVANRVGQPAVMGEMAAGVLLGPIVMGAAMPGVHAALFSPASLAGLSALSTFGLVLFMFVIGLELRWPQGVRARIQAAANVGALALVIAAAAIGKLAGGGLGARLAGCGWRDSLATGALMNARGLMELIVMKIGLDAGLIGREMFTILLLMALVTTAMATPMIALFMGRRPGAAPALAVDAGEEAASP